MDMTEYKNIAVYIETADKSPVKVGLEMLSPARKIAEEQGGKVIAVMIGDGIQEAAEKAAASGADEVILVQDPQYETFHPDRYANVLEEITAAEKPFALLIGGTQDGKDLAPKLAARLSTGCVSDVMDIKIEGGKAVYTCPLYGGCVLQDVTLEGPAPQIAVLRSGAFKKAEDPVQGVVEERNVPVSGENIRLDIKGIVKEIAETVNLEDAEVIVSGGRGMGNKENFSLVKELADLLGGVVGATRPAIEDGWISRVHQVGQSGKIVAPKLYIACGISGATQHVSGIMNSDYIVAVNKDEDAPIFDVANIGIVGDAVNVLPVMIEEIRKRKEAE
ncbi:electron transfer flavoprotein subunit alpha/FixB family protein [Anaerostipes sp.]|uniref:electron transfer flavoprotein subunit alpha/FixB family protein n=1 Tax=Anaerostipes sp. TaxID=1872530 RepID=UPI0025BB3CE7|nr:electron transfer flavoprotein subunit alpha/FixB family protein [Anaerostipes sp.]MBS7009273.1 electron transfer flavoprotein subunit alpha/FixB family protein [Anaerostipes sp.]